MTDSELYTPWFPSNVKPVRKGVYQTTAEFGGLVWWRYWNGRSWSIGFLTNEYAYSSWRRNKGATQNNVWRGLAEEPK